MFQLHKALNKLLTQQMLPEWEEREKGRCRDREREGEILSKKERQCRETRLYLKNKTHLLPTSHYLCLYFSLSLPLFNVSICLFLSLSLLHAIVCCFNQSKLTLGVKFIKMEIFRLLRYCFCLHVAIASLRRLVSGRCLLAACFLRQQFQNHKFQK